jgi:cold-inducible RNA-binding protein
MSFYLTSECINAFKTYITLEVKMNTKIYVGNLSYETENSDLETLFSAHGSVVMVNVVKDRDSGRARGFGFVEMKTNSQANDAIMKLNESDFMGRSLVVNMAKQRENRSFR